MSNAGVGVRRSSINILSIWASRFLSILVALVTIPIITRHFGLELVGIWLLVSLYAQHLLLLELGLNTSLTRFLSRYRGKEDLVEASRYLSGAVFVLFMMGVLVIAVTPLLALGFQSAFNLPPEIENQVYWLIVLASLFTGLSLPLRTGIAMLSSIHRFDRVAIWESVVLGTRLALVLICFYWFNPNLLFLGLITFVPLLFGNLLIFHEGRKANQDLIIGRRLITRQVLQHMFSISGATIAITLSAVVVRQSGPMLVGWQLGAAQVALLAYPLLIISTVMPFIGVANTLIAPVASQLDANKSHVLLYRIYTMAGKYVFSLALLGLLGFHYLGYPLLKLWLGGPKVDDEALHQMAEILVVIFFGFVLAAPGFIVREALIAVGRHWHAAGAELLGAILGVAIGLWLMMGMKLGMMGMAIGISIAFVVRGAGFLAIRGAQYFSVSYLRLMGDSMGRPLLIAGVAMLVSEVSLARLPQDAGDWVSGAAHFTAVAVLCFVGGWKWIIYPEHKQKLLAWLCRA